MAAWMKQRLGGSCVDSKLKGAEIRYEQACTKVKMAKLNTWSSEYQW